MQVKTCTAKSKRTGKPCKAWAVVGSNVCHKHGAFGGGPSKRGNTGLYRALLQPPEVAVAEAMKKAIKEEFGLDSVVDTLMLETAIKHIIIANRLHNADDKHARHYELSREREFRAIMESMALARGKRIGEQIKVRLETWWDQDKKSPSKQLEIE